MLIEKVYQTTLTYRCFSISVPVIEKPRFLDLVADLALKLNAEVKYWDIIKAHTDEETSSEIEVVLAHSPQAGRILSSIASSIKSITTSDSPTILVLENILGFLDKTQIDFTTAAYLRTALGNAIADFKTSQNKYLILLDTENNLLPSSLTSILPAIDYPLPTAPQLSEHISNYFKLNSYQVDDGLIERAAIASLGLSLEEVAIGLSSAIADKKGEIPNYSRDEEKAESNEKLNTPRALNSDIILQKKSKNSHKEFGDRLINTLVGYKKGRLKQTGLEFMPPPDVKDFGGLDRIKTAIARVKKDFSPQAREFNLPIPKGWLLVGPPGTGKTFSAKVCASLLGFPLISIGVDSVLAGGSSYLKKLLLRIDAVGGAIAYFDEFDKFFADINDSRTKEVLGVLLTWLAEKTSLTFVMATLNRFDNLPAELTRAGRFDRIWYVDFPNTSERYHIFTIHLSRFDRRYCYDGDKVISPLATRDWQVLLKETINFTGAEIRNLVEDAARDCFYSGRSQINLKDLLEVRSQMTSLYARDPESICAMANRAKKCSTPASSPDRGLFAPTPTNHWGQPLRSSSH